MDTLETGPYWALLCHLQDLGLDGYSELIPCTARVKFLGILRQTSIVNPEIQVMMRLRVSSSNTSMALLPLAL